MLRSAECPYLIHLKTTAGKVSGFEEKRTRYNTYQIALPEKALLDWIYLSRQEGLPTPVDEINIQFLNHRKLREFAEKFPRTVREVVNQLLLDHAIAA